MGKAVIFMAFRRTQTRLGVFWNPMTDNKLPPKLIAVMAMTTALTFGTLVSGYQLLFTVQ